MMKNLLENDFIAHYKLAVNVTVNIVSTTDISFELKDDTTLVYPSGAGIAKYSNTAEKEVNVINYETFFKSLSSCFQQGKKNCDLIVYTTDFSHFLLNELTSTNKKKGRKRTHSIEQMLQVLKEIWAVPSIKCFINSYSVKRCCYFNKKVQAPAIQIKAAQSFGRLRDIKCGFKMPVPDIESFGFEMWEFSGNQTYQL